MNTQIKEPFARSYNISFFTLFFIFSLSISLNTNALGITDIPSNTVGDLKVLIADDEVIPIDDFIIDPIGDYIYTGQPIEPSVTLSDLTGTVLTENVDYTADYSHNTSAGTANIVIIGKDKYSGSVSVTFNITPATLTVKAHSQIMVFGMDPSSLDTKNAFDVEGFVGKETLDDLKSLPEVKIDNSITSHTSAGIYQEKVLVSGAAADNYIFTYISNTLTIVKNVDGDHLIFDEIPTKTYGNSPFILNGYHALGKSVTFESDNPSVVSVTYNGQNWIATVRNAGSTVIRIKFAGDNDCEAEEKEQQVTVNKAPLYVSALEQFRGQGQANFDVSSNYCISGYVNAADAGSFITWPTAYINPDYDIRTPVGIYKDGVLVDGGEHPNYYMVYQNGVLTIETITREIHFAPFCNKTCGDSPFLLLASHTTGLYVKYESLNPDIISVAQYSGVWKATIHHIGTATIRAYVEGVNDTNASEKFQTITVVRAPIEIRPDNKSKYYGDENPSLSVSFYGLKYEDTAADFGDNITINTNATVTSNAGTYSITASGARNDNYNISYSPGYLTINKAIVIISLDNDKSVYTGQPLHTNPATISGIIGNVNLPISYRYSKSGSTSTSSSAINAGIYEVTAITTGDRNHAGASTKASFNVGKATPVITLTAVNTEYDENPVYVNTPVITGSTTSQSLPYTAKYKGTGETDYPETTNAPIDYGTYEATVSTQGDANHYPASSKTTISIGKGTPVMSLIGKTKIYDGTPLSISASIVPPNLEITYIYKGTLNDGTVYSPTDKAPIDAGKYTVTASTVGNHNYAAASVTADIEITRKAANIVMNNKSTPYTGEPISIETPITEPATALLLITYTGTVKTDYPESQQAPKNGGTYLVKAAFAGNNNYLPTQATANLTITDAGTPTLTLDNKTVVYNGSKQAIGEAKISPVIAEYLTVTYTYTNADYLASTTPPINAGVYTVTATTSADSNFKAGSVTATLIIEKADQTITFPELGTISISEGSLNAGATVNTGLTLVFSSGNTDIAEVETSGIITFNKAGIVTITASQEGNENYNPVSLSRTLNIMSNDATLYGLRVNGIRMNISENMYYDLNCSEIKEFDIVLETEANATVTTGKTFSITIDQPMLKIIEVVITSQDRQVTKTYRLTIEKRFRFDDIVKTRWNNTMTVINNPDNNGGYRFTSFKWFRNGQEIATGQSYSAGNLYETLNPTDKYYVELTGEQFGGTLRSCEGSPKLRSQIVKAYPNPALLRETIYVEADVDEELLEGAVIDVYSISGLKIMQLKVEGKHTPVKLSNASTYIFKFKGKDGFCKDLRVIVK